MTEPTLDAVAADAVRRATEETRTTRGGDGSLRLARGAVAIDVAPRVQTAIYVRGPQGEPTTQREVAVRRKLAGLGIGGDWRCLQVRWSWEDALAKARYFTALHADVRCVLVVLRTEAVDGLVFTPEELVAVNGAHAASEPVPTYRDPHVLRPGDDDDYYGVTGGTHG